ncbi:LRR receptor-like serine/threonine-protein kinase FLS2 [Vigna radiata var. radiata]|uniref:LRR receptor-like serine/threonine-protein kinase FLS2 n=1 Tax=Vigna radiata var. radiata TaxID=3916 RepID=A0A1S3VGA3_VIGRR|nr:LRR receptor-like serine/threonine-protein kinase FLS2 [Vigna radiata var. radiata]
MRTGICEIWAERDFGGVGDDSSLKQEGFGQDFSERGRDWLRIFGSKSVENLSWSLSGRATSLNVTGLDDGLLSPSVGDLSELRVLSLVGNMFSGEIPATVRNLRFLEVLELQGNNFSGRVPTQMSFAFLQSLKLVNLSGNAFSGSIVNEIIGYGSVKVVDLSNNQFSGVIPLNGTCDSLKHLKLSRNFLTGEIPSQIGKCRTLRTLLDRDDGGLNDGFRGEFNAFVGNIPHQVLLLPSLRVLWAPRANLGGRLPSG